MYCELSALRRIVVAVEDGWSLADWRDLVAELVRLGSDVRGDLLAELRARRWERVFHRPVALN